MSIDAITSRIGQIQSRISQIEERFEHPPMSRFALQLDKPAAPMPAAPSGAPASPLGLGPSAGPAPKAPGLSGSLQSMISEAARRNEVDPALVRAVMTAESNGNPRATSPVGAMGLMQLMPGTAKDLGVKNAYDPQQNLNGGTRYLGELTRRFGLEEGVAAYNAGPGAVARHGGVPPYPETQHYVKKVISLYNEYKQ